MIGTKRRSGRRSAVAAVASILSAALIVGCGPSNQQTVNNDGLFDEIKYDDGYPINTDKKLTWYTYLHSALTNEYRSLNETPFAQYLRENTGVDIEFIHPNEGASADTDYFSLMLASNDLPDIIEAGWHGAYRGGAQLAIDEGVIIPLNDALGTIAPNLKAYFDTHPEADKMMKTDEGNYFMFPFIRGDEILKTFSGPMLRKDLLDKANLDMPETVEEWDTALRAFKDMGIGLPLVLLGIGDWVTMDGGSDFIQAYGLAYGFHVVDGQVRFGAYDPRVKQYYELLHGWFKEGLLDNGVGTENNNQRINAEMLNGNIGAAFSTAGGGFGSWAQGLKKTVPEADFQPTNYPVLNKGETPFNGQRDHDATNYGGAISAQCEDPELAARVLDYGYSPEGQIMYNFGREGVSYTMIDNIPTYTDIITDQTKNGDVSLTQAMSRHIRGNSSGPFIQNKYYLLQFYPNQFQRDAVEIWSKTDADKHKLPILTFTEDESLELDRIMRDVNTVREESTLKFIHGLRSLDTFDQYLGELKALGVERAIEINQAAYDRYLAR